jgi:TRAP transporter TAXI family solute receptor
MTRVRVRRWMAAAVVATFLFAAGSAGSRLGAPDDGGRLSTPIVLATGTPNGVYHQLGEALADAAVGELGPARTLATAGSVENLRLLAEERSTFAFTTMDVAVAAYYGQAPFRRSVPVRAVARLYDDYLHLVTFASSRVHTLTDLRGLRVSVGSKGSGTALVADRVLDGAGLRPERDIVRAELSLTEAIEAMHEGRIDAFFWAGGLPTPGMTELANSTPIRLIDLTDAADTLRAEYGSVYRTKNILAGTYRGMTAAVTTIAVPSLLVATDATSPETVERMAGVLFSTASLVAASIPAVSQVDPHAAIFTQTIPLHDGARDYYRATKVPA